MPGPKKLINFLDQAVCLSNSLLCHAQTHTNTYRVMLRLTQQDRDPSVDCLGWPSTAILKSTSMTQSNNQETKINTPRQICFPLNSSYIALLDDLLTCNEILNAIKFVDQCYFYCDYCMLEIYPINNPTRFQLHVSKHEPQVTMLLQPLHYICWTKRNFYWGIKMSVANYINWFQACKAQTT